MPPGAGVRPERSNPYSTECAWARRHCGGGRRRRDRHTAAGVITAIAAAMAGCSSLGQPSLYERLGGEPAMEMLVNGFVDTMRRDPQLEAKFRQVNIPRLKLLIADQLCAAAGGPCTYTGNDMRTAHARLGVTDAQFDAALADFKASLAAVHAPPDAAGALLQHVEATRADIVRR